MPSALSYLLIWVLIALPFSCLAYGIFLIKENKTGKYKAVYKRAVIVLGLFVVILFSYYLIPRMIVSSSSDPLLPVEGKYLSNTGDTLRLENGIITIRNGRDTSNNLTGTYIVSSLNNTDAGFLYQLTGTEAAVTERILAVSYTKVQKPTTTKQRSNKRSSTTAPSVRNLYVEWFVKVTDDGIRLEDPNNRNFNAKTFSRLK